MLFLSYTYAVYKLRWWINIFRSTHYISNNTGAIMSVLDVMSDLAESWIEKVFDFSMLRDLGTESWDLLQHAVLGTVRKFNSKRN